MTEQTAAMVDMFLRVVGLALIPAVVQTVCLVSGALFVLGIARITAREKSMGCGCGGGKRGGGKKR